MSLDDPPLTLSFTASSLFSSSSSLPTTSSVSPSQIASTPGSPTDTASSIAGSSTYSLTLSSGLSEPISATIETSSRGTLKPSSGLTQESPVVSSVASTKFMESSIRSDSSAGPTTSSAPVEISPSESPRGASTSLSPSVRTPLPPPSPSSVAQPAAPPSTTMSSSRVTRSESVATSRSNATGPSRPPMNGGPASTSSPASASSGSPSASGSSNTAVSTSRSTSSSRSSSSRATSPSSSRPPASSSRSTVTSVIVVAPPARTTSQSTSTLFVDPETTLESAVPVTITSDDAVITSTPEFVTIVMTSTEPDGDLVVHTQIAANPNFGSRSAEQSRGILDNKGAAAGIFVTIGVVTSVVSVILFMIWRKRRRTERRKQWFAGMREARAGSVGSNYPFNGDGGIGGVAAAGGGGMSSNRSSGFIQGMATGRKSDEDYERGGNLWGRQQTPPSHYRTHSTLAPVRGYNLSPMAFPEPPSPLPANDSMSSLGLAGIGAGTGVNARGFPSPSRKPVSAHLYGDDLKELDQSLQQSNAPASATRSRFGLSPIHETAAPHSDDYFHPSLPVPPSSYQYNPRMAPSPSPSSPSLYPPTLPADDEGYNAEYSEGCSDEYGDDARRPLSNSQAAAPPRPPRSRLRESGTSMLMGKSNGEHTGSFQGYTPAPLTPPAASAAQQHQHDPSQKAKIALSLDNLFTRIHGGAGNDTKKDDEDTHLPTPASSTRSPQDILMNRRTLLDVRPRSLRSDASSN